MAKRRYEQRLRAEAAEETRRRILDAVYERLREAPSAAGQRRPDRADGGRRPLDGLPGLRLPRRASSTPWATTCCGGTATGACSTRSRDPDARESLRARHARGGARCTRPHRDVAPGPLLDGAARPGGGRRRGAAVRGTTRTRGMARLARRLAEQGVAASRRHGR